MVDQIQKLAASHADQGLRAFVVYTGGPALKPAIEQITGEKHITIPVTYLPQGKDSPALKYYKISPQAKNTILTYREKTVTADFVDVDATTFPKVADAAAALLK